MALNIRIFQAKDYVSVMFAMQILSEKDQNK
jgi:hypothetical protein